MTITHYEKHRKFKHQTGSSLCCSVSLLCLHNTRCNLPWSPTTCCSAGRQEQILQLSSALASYLVSHLHLIVVPLQKKTDNNLDIYKSRPATVGSGQNSSSSSVISKKLQLKSIFIPRIPPHISPSESENLRMDI